MLTFPYLSSSAIFAGHETAIDFRSIVYDFLYIFSTAFYLFQMKFRTMLGPPEFKQWNIENNYVDTVYNLKFIK